MANGTYAVAAEGVNDDLYTFLSQTQQSKDSKFGMLSGTSPAIAAIGGVAKGFEAAFESNVDTFTTFDSNQQGHNTQEPMLNATSPALAGSTGGGWEPAFVDASGHLASWGMEFSPSVATGSSPSIATSSSLVAPTSTYPIYSQQTTSSQDCVATTGDPLSPNPYCDGWANQPHIATPGQYFIPTPVDFCVNYGTGASKLDTSTSRDLTGLVGFGAPASKQFTNTTGSTCSTTGTDSRYGLLLQGSSSNGYCINAACGIQHGVNFPYPGYYLYPWYANGQLTVSGNYDPVSDSVTAQPNSSWHSYLCPWVHDGVSNQGFQLCSETWRSDQGSPAVCTSENLGGANLCISGGVVQSICDLDTTGYDECVDPGFAPPGVPAGGIVWTRPQSGTRLATNTGAVFQGKNALGNRKYSMTVTQANLKEILRLLNLALSVDHQNGQLLTTPAYSNNPADFTVSALEIGDEGIAVNGGTSVWMGANMSKLQASSQY